MGEWIGAAMPYIVNEKIYTSWDRAFDAWTNDGDDSELEFVSMAHLTRRAFNRLWYNISKFKTIIRR